MLRDYQRAHKGAIISAWDAGARNVMGVLPTGAGKTTVFSDILREKDRPSCVTAHRSELIAQAALALNANGVHHGVIAPKPLIQQIIRLEMETHGHSLYSTRAACRVAGVNTLAVRDKDRWYDQVEYVVPDEGHHVLRENIFGKAVLAFPNARGLFPTAHAVRADGSGLGRNADGLVDTLIRGPSGRELIQRGFLVDYRVLCPQSDIDVSAVPVTGTGDYSPKPLAKAIHESKTIVGDVVHHYLKWAGGKLGLTFAVDVEAAGQLAAAYRGAGVPAEVITGDTPILVRAALMRKFRAREILQLVSVDVLGEGTDVPAVEVVSMARHTASWQLFCQQFGRMLRLMITPELMAQWDNFTDEQRLAYIAASPKPRGILIDHVGNFLRHVGQRGTPDSPQVYSLDRRERKSKSAIDSIPLRTCLNLECVQPYERVLVACPHCGTPAPEPAGRTAPEMVDGDLIELDPSVLQQMRGEIARVDGPARIPQSLPPYAVKSVQDTHIARQAAQYHLRHRMSVWAGYQRHLGRANDRENQRRFFLQFGIDVMTAQALNAKDAAMLDARISAWLMDNNIVEAGQ